MAGAGVLLFSGCERWPARPSRAISTALSVSGGNFVAVAKLTLGRTVKHRRLELCLSLDELAAKAGVSRSTLLRLEQDETACSFPRMVRISRPLALSLDELAESVA